MDIDSLKNDFIRIDPQNASSFRSEIGAGLLSPQALVSPKYLYDKLGSKLFEAICDLPEYYLTRIESEIIDENIFEIGKSIGQGKILIDLGAGNCAKAANLFSTLKPRQYIPIDISIDCLKTSLSQLRIRFPQIEMSALEMDFSSSLELPDLIRSDNRVFFFLGSSIGNFEPREALSFLKWVHRSCAKDGSLLVGVDLIKDPSILHSAYNDSLGVTAAFNLNVLRHLNVLLKANFNVQNWQHRGYYNTQLNRVEMHLVAKYPVSVNWLNGHRNFSKGERIHTENSYKYKAEHFPKLLELAGFGTIRIWTDPQQQFMLCHAKVGYEH